MINLITQIRQELSNALKARDNAKLSTLRLLLAELEKEKIAQKLGNIGHLTNEQVENVISRQIKKLDKEIESYVAVGRTVESQELEKKLLQSYLPEQLSEDEIREVVVHAISLVKRGEIDNPMRYLSQRLRGIADMGLVSKIVKEIQ